MAAVHKCSDCGRDTDRMGEYYMAKDHVWKAALAKKPIKSNKDGAKMLCLTDLEKRIGRPLKSTDFADVPANKKPATWYSPKLAKLLAPLRQDQQPKAQAPKEHAMQRGKRGGQFYLSNGRRVYAKK